MWSSKKLFFKWWLIVALIYLIFSAVITWHYGTDFLMPMNDDTAHHIKLAENLIKYQTFSLDGLYSPEEPKQPLVPTNFLTPGYALWLALIYTIFNSFIPAIFIGALVFAISIPLTYLLAQEITGNKKIAFWSALIFMIEPLSIYHSGLMFTEQLFVPVFLSAAYFFIKYLKTENKNFAFGSLFIFSLSVFIRPIIFYLLPVLVLIVFFKELKISIKHALILGTISLILAYSIIGVWLVRNKIVLNTWQISSNQGAILAAHYGLVAKSLKKSNLDIPLFQYKSNNFTTEYNNNLGGAALKELIKYKWTYLKIKLDYMPAFFISNGYDNFFNRFTGQLGLSGSNKVRDDLASAIINYKFSDFFNIINRVGLGIAIFFLGAVFWIGTVFLALFGAWRSWRGGKALIVAIIILVLYFAFVSSPWVVARYRLPINPFIFIFAVSGFYFLKEKLKQWI